MFISQTHLPQILPIESYRSPEQHQRELAELFLPAWHYVGTIADAPADGDYFTTEILGEPIIVWHRNGEFQAFLNVCPHRFSIIAESACGHAGERLRCQYHGWEFDEYGNTKKIPDARSFRPMEQGALGLTRFRTELCGQLIFVSLAPDGPDLAEFLGDGYRVAQELFGPERRELLRMDYELDANWKVKIENTLESYHVEMVHPKTFMRMPAAEDCSHELELNGSTFSAIEDAPTATRRFLDRLIHRIAGFEIDREYKHYIYYPHIMFAKLRFTSWIEVVYPISPTRCRVMMRSFCDRGPVGRIRSAIAYRGLRQYSKDFGRTAAAEDSAAIRRVQRGLTAREMPSKGLLSVREERLFHFQEYVLKATGSDAHEAAILTGS